MKELVWDGKCDKDGRRVAPVKIALPLLLPKFAGKVNLIHSDPPFATVADFSFNIAIPESDNSFTKAIMELTYPR